MTLNGPYSPSPWGEVYDAAALLLTYVGNYFTDKGVPLPARQYVGNGLTAVQNCEQLTVTLNRLFPGQPGVQQGQPIGSCPPTLSAVYRVELVRCVPTINDRVPPDPAVIQASAQLVLRDVLLLGKAVRDAASRILGPTAVQIDQSTPLVPKGGYGGAGLDVQIPLGEIIQQ